MQHLCGKVLKPGAFLPTEGTPWDLTYEFEVGPFALPMVTYILRYQGRARWQSDKWCLLNRSSTVRLWEMGEVVENLLQVGYHSREAPQPDLVRTCEFVRDSRRLLVEAHVARVAEQFGSILSSEDVAQIWGIEDVKRVMLS